MDYYDRLSDIGFAVYKERLSEQQDPAAVRGLGLSPDTEVTFNFKQQDYALSSFRPPSSVTL